MLATTNDIRNRGAAPAPLENKHRCNSASPSPAGSWAKRAIWLTATAVAALPLIAGDRLLTDHRTTGHKEHNAAASTTAASTTAASTTATFLGNSPDNPLIVDVTGKNFRWEFQIRGAANSVADPSHLSLPAGTYVQWNVTSADYVYIFSLPEITVRKVTSPGIVSQVATGPLKAATYDLLMDPLCGFRFWNDVPMGRVVVKPE
jgi:heme/copper-type cytochrome/quinol oxidase subunit 2